MLNKLSSRMLTPAATLTLTVALCLAPRAFALNYSGSQGNKASFETLEEARVSSPLAVVPLEAGGPLPPGSPASAMRRTYKSHPVLDGYPKGTTFIYRSANMYGGRAAARINTNLIIYVEQHFDTKDSAFAYLKAAGLIGIADEGTGSIVLVTPVGKTFDRRRRPFLLRPADGDARAKCLWH